MKNTTDPTKHAVSLKLDTKLYGQIFQTTNTILCGILTDGGDLDQRKAGCGSVITALVAKILDPKADFSDSPVADKASDKLLADFMARRDEE